MFSSPCAGSDPARRRSTRPAHARLGRPWRPRPRLAPPPEPHHPPSPAATNPTAARRSASLSEFPPLQWTLPGADGRPRRRGQLRDGWLLGAQVRRLYAQNLRRSRPGATSRWHLDEMVAKIGGRCMWLWRAVDDEGEVLDVLVQKRRNKGAALKLLRKLLSNQGVRPQSIVTDKLASYRAAARDLNLTDRHRPGGMRANNRRKTGTWPSNDESESSRSSRARARPKGSSPRMPPSTTPSTSSPT